MMELGVGRGHSEGIRRRWHDGAGRDPLDEKSAVCLLLSGTCPARRRPLLHCSRLARHGRIIVPFAHVLGHFALATVRHSDPRIVSGVSAFPCFHAAPLFARSCVRASSTQLFKAIRPSVGRRPVGRSLARGGPS